MLRRLQHSIVAVSLAVASSYAIAQVPATDIQQWSQFSVVDQVKPKVAFTGFGEIRLGNNASQFDEELLSGGVVYSPKRWLSLGSGYLYIHANPNLSGLNHESRYYTEATFKAPAFHGFVLSNRVRTEVRWLQVPSGSKFTQRYRERIVLERPLTIQHTTYVPYLRYEKFYDMLVDDWSRNRYYAGFSRPLVQRTALEVYYMHQDDHYFHPFHKNAIGFNVTWHLGKEGHK